MMSVAATVKRKIIQESEIQVSVCVENVCPCLRMRKFFAVKIQKKYLTIILKVTVTHK